MTEKALALRLADRLEDTESARLHLLPEAAAELRRLHAVNAELLGALAAASVALSTGHNALIALDKARAAIKAAENAEEDGNCEYGE
jgi:hypothetical protein